MLGNELVELLLFDTTGQVMIAALASVHSALLDVRPATASAYILCACARLGAISA